MHKLIGFGLIASTTLLLAGCDTLSGGELVRPGTATGTLIITNGSYEDLDAVVISECSAMSYGFNRLADGAYIPPGSSATFTVSAGCWDVGGGTFGGGEAYQRLDVAAYGVTELTIN